MRILIAAEARLGAGDSGAERVLDGHVVGLTARGHDVVVLCPGAAAPPGDRVTVRRVGWSPLTPWRARRAVDDALRAQRADAIVAHHPLPAALLGAAARRAGVPLVAVVHSPWHEEFEVRHPGRGVGRRLRATLRRRVEGHVLARADRVCALSRFMAGRIAALHGLAPGAVCVVPGGVDRERFAPVADRRPLRRRLGLPEGGPVLFCLRNLEPRMGVDVLLEAMPAILARHGDTVLVVGGVGPLAASLHARAQALRLGPAVRFAGFVPETELAAFYAAADAFVLPSQRLEGFGLVTLESLACGTPVVATRVGATPELLEPVDPALLVETPTAAGLARAVVALLARSDREALGARCRAHTAAYTWACVAARLEGVLTGAGGA